MMDNKEKFTIQDFIIQLEKINYLEILDFIKPLIIYYITGNVIDIYRIHRDYKPKNISKVLLPPELNVEYSEIDINKIVAKKYGESILKFAEVVINNFPAEDLTNFYNNINDLKTKSKKYGIRNIIVRSKTAGEYGAKKNEITVDTDLDVESTIYHELFHMASSTYKDGIAYVGFHQTSSKPEIKNLGKGINEGYTELLTERYFGENTHIKAYTYEVFIAKKIEQIIGKEKIQSLYLNSNLKGLIDELKQYISEDEVMKFISNVDFLVEHMDDKKLQLFDKNKIENCLKNINRFFIICYSKKLQKQSKDGNISTDDELLQKLGEFISSLAHKLQLGKSIYEVMTNDDIKESLKASFEKTNDTVSINQDEHSEIKR